MKNRVWNLCLLITVIIIISSTLANAQVAQLTQRQITLNAIASRPGDPWPRGEGHVLLAEPGGPLTQKGYHEPGGSFSPEPGSFGVAIWIVDSSNKLIATSDNIPLEKITQQYVWKEGNKVPSIKTETPYYSCTWTYDDMGSWQLDVGQADKVQEKLLLVVRSVGPAGGPLNSAIWDNSRLLVNRRWKITPEVLPESVFLGDEERGQLFVDTPDKDSVLNSNGWAFAKMKIDKTSFTVKITDSKPVFKSPLSYEKTVSQFQFDVPDKRFKESLNAQIANLMMGYIGKQTGPGEPVNYPLAWERDGAYSLMAIARSGNLQTARDLSIYFAENDFFGGFGAEGDAAGSEISALTEVACLIDEPAYYQWLWPHIQRKLGYIDEMMNATSNIYKQYLGPLVPYLERGDLKRRQLISQKQDIGLVCGSMDLHIPALYITAVSYRGLIQASRLALKVEKPEISAQCIEKADKLKAAWLNAFVQNKYNDERNFMISVWPTWITSKDCSLFVQRLEAKHAGSWKDGTQKDRQPWSYFTVAEAHQWLLLDRPDYAWETLEYFWGHQCSPGLYSYWEGNGEENSFHGWDNYRGWLKPKCVTPHYWTASEMALFQLDMLVCYDESGAEPVLVVGAGVPRNWTDRQMSVESYKTKFGTVSWSYGNNVLKVQLSGFKTRYKVRAGASFGNSTTLNVEYK